MRRFSLFFSVGLVAIFAVGCTREEVVLKESDVAARIDSIVQLQTEFAKQRAAEDLDRRQAIEVKVKTDSILEARRNGTKAASPLPTDREP